MILSIIIVILLSGISIFYSLAIEDTDKEERESKKDFIKWVDFNVTSEALNLTAKLDIDSHNKKEELTFNWIELLAYLSCKNGGNFKNFKANDLNLLVEELKKRTDHGRFNTKYEIL